jgi:hypothetical protein
MTRRMAMPLIPSRTGIRSPGGKSALRAVREEVVGTLVESDMTDSDIWLPAKRGKCGN